MTAILDAIFNISKRSRMPEWHQLDSSGTMSKQQESAKKKNFKIKFQVILVFYRTIMFLCTCIRLSYMLGALAISQMQQLDIAINN